MEHGTMSLEPQGPLAHPQRNDRPRRGHGGQAREAPCGETGGSMSEAFNDWAILELMGHRRLARSARCRDRILKPLSAPN